MSEVTIVDYGAGNLLSVKRGLEYFGAAVDTTADPERILTARRLVLPGVGAFRMAMQSLETLGLAPAICEAVYSGTPLLGICLGMQLLLDESDEFGLTKGLGLIGGRVIAIPDLSIDGERLKSPHIGWSPLLSRGAERWGGAVLCNNAPGDEMYFVHSFMATPKDPAHCLADCEYGGYRIPAVIMRDNVVGCQFHPEKSGELGLKILQQFLLTQI